MDPIISVEHLTKRYKKSATPAVDDISFDVGEGELFAFLGPNGAGKTTTISILTTTLAKTSGTVVIDGHDLDRDAKAVRAQHRDHLPEPDASTSTCRPRRTSASTSPCTGSTAIGPFYRLMPAEYRARVEHLAHVVGLEEKLFKPLQDLLGRHEAQARDHPQPDAPARDPVPRRADLGPRPGEPHSLWRYLRDVRNEDGTTVFLTTHYLEEAEEADRVCVVDHGRIAMIGLARPHEARAARALDRARRRRPRRPARRAARARRRARRSTRPGSSGWPTRATRPSP